MEFTIPELILFTQGTNYNPALSAAVNKLIRTRDQGEYTVALQEATTLVAGYQNIEIGTRKQYGESSFFPGQPLFMPVKFSADGLEDLLLESAITDLTQQRNIIVTAVQGRDSSVKEFINNGDWTINFTGLLADTTPNYPIQQVLRLEEYMQLKAPIRITHELMNALGIYEIVVMNHKLPKSPGINCQAYQIDAISSQPLPLIIQDNNIETF